MTNQAEVTILLKDFTSVCRGCLESSRETKDMFEFGLDEDFYKLTNIKVDRSDALSKQLCADCEDVITRCRSFREQCSQSDFILNIVVKKQSGNVSDTKLSDKVSQNTIKYYLCDKKLVIKITAPDTEAKLSYECPQKCPDTFKKKNDLLNHLIRRHNFDNNFVVDVEYYCSVINCHYHIDSVSRKHFSGRKYLNQHLCKVHQTKITCSDCLLNFPNNAEYNRHLNNCNTMYNCQMCDKEFKTNERLLVHMLRKHPDLHNKYKTERKAEKRKIDNDEVEKLKSEIQIDFACDSPKRSFATQTLDLERHIKNDVTLPSWQQEKSDETKKDEISTQTMFEDLLSLKSQTSEDDSIFYSETVSLSDIQTQTLPLEFGLSRSNKETITSETQSPDLSIKETQTCFCLYDSLKSNFRCDAMSSGSFCTTETQTLTLETDFSSAETQTCFDDDSNKF